MPVLALSLTIEKESAALPLLREGGESDPTLMNLAIL